MAVLVESNTIPVHNALVAGEIAARTHTQRLYRCCTGLIQGRSEERAIGGEGGEAVCVVPLDIT